MVEDDVWWPFQRVCRTFNAAQVSSWSRVTYDLRRQTTGQKTKSLTHFQLSHVSKSTHLDVDLYNFMRSCVSGCFVFLCPFVIFYLLPTGDAATGQHIQHIRTHVHAHIHTSVPHSVTNEPGMFLEDVPGEGARRNPTGKSCCETSVTTTCWNWQRKCLCPPSRRFRTTLMIFIFLLNCLVLHHFVHLF